jgi:predicted ferric reductase
MAIVKKYKAEIVSIKNHFENIYTIEMISKYGNFKYLPGQFLHFALDEYDPSFNWPESRCFSMQSSPQCTVLKITYATKGSFTQRMAKELYTGKIVDIKLPYGELFQQTHSKENVVFIAGGTGVTPYLSSFTDQSFISYKNPKLYFGLREKRFNIYQRELDLAKEINPTLSIKIVYQDEQGILDINRIVKENSEHSTFFLSGPHAMISDFKKFMIANGVLDNNIKTDDWE